MDNKDQKILDVVHYLQKKYGSENILIKDHWDDDINAIGITDQTGEHLIYISISGCKETNLYIALEEPSVDPLPNDNSLPYTPAGDYENVELNGLEEILVTHFRMN